MGRQGNKPQGKGKEESSERMLNETGTSQLLDIKFKTMIKRRLNEFTEN